MSQLNLDMVNDENKEGFFQRLLMKNNKMLELNKMAMKLKKHSINAKIAQSFSLQLINDFFFTINNRLITC